MRVCTRANRYLTSEGVSGSGQRSYRRERVSALKTWGDFVQRIYFTSGRNCAGRRPVMMMVLLSGLGSASSCRKLCVKPSRGFMALRSSVSLGLEVCMFRVVMAVLMCRAVHRNIYAVKILKTTSGTIVA